MGKNMAATSENLREIYHHTPAGKPRPAERSNQPVQRKVILPLFPERSAIKSTVKITPEMGRQLIALRRSRVPVYNYAQIFDEINRIALEKRLETAQKASGAWCNGSNVRKLSSFGMTLYSAKWPPTSVTAGSTRRKLPDRRDTLWYGDGTKLNLYYRDEDGKVRTTMVYEVVDAYSEVLLGYYISDHENFEAQYNAYRMAIQVSGHKPFGDCARQPGRTQETEPEGRGRKEGFFRQDMPYPPSDSPVQRAIQDD